tara:strand:- start:211 stop:333 length:123 start_codon:yes stop_codon:yes gene_type:complete
MFSTFPDRQRYFIRLLKLAAKFGKPSMVQQLEKVSIELPK